MDFKVMNYQYYRAIYNSTQTDELIGTQCIYSFELQDILIQTFFKDNFIKFYFQINDIILNPCYNCPCLPKNTIVVSNDIFLQYFNESSQFKFHFVYDIPKIKSISLKKINGQFPTDESLNDLLTYYLESNIVINLHQKFTIDYISHYISFEIVNFEYEDIEITRTIQDRLTEMNLTIDFNTHYIKNPSMTYNDCSILVQNYSWLKNIDYKYGDVSHQEVTILFEEESKCPCSQISNTTMVQTADTILSRNIPRKLINENIETLSKEDLRKKRLHYFSK
jgi:hypothetical protein